MQSVTLAPSYFPLFPQKGSLSLAAFSHVPDAKYFIISFCKCCVMSEESRMEHLLTVTAWWSQKCSVSHVTLASPYSKSLQTTSIIPKIRLGFPKAQNSVRGFRQPQRIIASAKMITIENKDRNSNHACPHGFNSNLSNNCWLSWT